MSFYPLQYPGLQIRKVSIWPTGSRTVFPVTKGVLELTWSFWLGYWERLVSRPFSGQVIDFPAHFEVLPLLGTMGYLWNSAVADLILPGKEIRARPKISLATVFPMFSAP